MNSLLSTALIVVTSLLVAFCLFVGPLYINYRRVRKRNHELRANLKEYAEHEKELRDRQFAGMSQAQEAFRSQNDQIVELNKWLRGRFTEDELAKYPTWVHCVKAKIEDGRSFAALKNGIEKLGGS